MRRYILALLFSLFLPFLFAGCEANAGDGGCAEGTLGCPCNAEGVCFLGLTCSTIGSTAICEDAGDTVTDDASGPGEDSAVIEDAGEDAQVAKALFVDSGQLLGDSSSWNVSLGDLDGDGDLDAFVLNSDEPDRVWLNDGNGVFSDSGHALGGDVRSFAVSLGDVDGDDDLDAFVGNNDGESNRLWLNGGRGTFTDSGQALGVARSFDVELGDLDGDDDLDAFVGNFTAGANRVWLNDASGVFSDAGQEYGDETSYAVALDDLDGDGDLDVFVADASSCRVWMNDGAGNLTDSQQTYEGISVSLGDLDGDTDIDAVVGGNAHQSGSTLVLFNDGKGILSDSGQTLTGTANGAIDLGDVDEDGDLDVLLSEIADPDTRIAKTSVWLNNGVGGFSESDDTLDSTPKLALGDLDGDGDLDVFTLDFGANKVWLNTSIP